MEGMLPEKYLNWCQERSFSEEAGLIDHGALFLPDFFL